MKEKQLLLKFMKMEEKNNFFNLSFKNHNFWEYVRRTIYFKMKYYYQNEIMPYIYFGNENFDIIEGYEKKYFILDNLKNKDILIFNHPRRVKKNNQYINMNSDIVAEFLSKSFSCAIIEESFCVEMKNPKVSHLTPPYFFDTYYLDLLEREIYSQMNAYKQENSNEMRDLVETSKKITTLIKKEFSKTEFVEINNFIIDMALYICFAWPIYEKLIKDSNVKKVLMFFSPSRIKLIVCEICRNLEIKTFELQHGMQTEYEPFFYNVHNKKRNLKALPQYILTFGEKSFCLKGVSANLKNKIIPCGFAYLEKRYHELKNVIVKAEKKYILFVSQTAIADKFIKVALELSKLLKTDTEYQILYKLHPFENELDYKFFKNENITIINNENNDLNYYQNISFCQVGVYSTGLYEGLMFNLPTFIIGTISGAEGSMALLKKEKNVIYVKDAKDIYKHINKGIKRNKSKCRLWQNDALNKIKQALEKV